MLSSLGLGAAASNAHLQSPRVSARRDAFGPPAPIQLGGLTDPDLQTRLRRAWRAEMTIVELAPGGAQSKAIAAGLEWMGPRATPEGSICVLVAMGRAPNPREGLAP